MELGGFVDPFEPIRNLLTSLRSNVDGILDFLDATQQQPNAARISVAKTVWMTQQRPGQHFPSEASVDEILRISRGDKQD